jgi:dTMP kinase
MGIFISIDGVDGVGKTTAARRIAAKLGYKYYKSPAKEFAELRKEVDKYASPVGRYAFYRLALQRDSEEIEQALAAGSVISDRYIASTLAYHLVLDPRIQTIHSEAGLLKPTFSILLSARSEVRIARLEKRRQLESRAPSDVKLEDNVALMDNVAEMFRTLGLKEIDTSDMSCDEVVTRIEEIIGGG